MNIKINKSYIRSTIPLKGTMITNSISIKSRLSNYPNFKLLDHSKWPSYMIQIENSDIFYIIELKSDKILFSLYSKVSPLYSLKDMLLRLFSIASILSDDYSIQTNSIFPYLINVLSKQEIIKDTAKYNYNRDPELILSRRVICLLSDNKNLKNTANKLEHELLKVTSDLILNKYSTNTNLKQISSETGLNQQYISSILKLLQQKSNRLIYNKNGNFDIVRI